MPSHSILSYFGDASLVVKVVMLILLAASVTSWTFIIQRWKYLQNAFEDCKAFENLFWSGKTLEQLQAELINSRVRPTGSANIFQAGYSEFNRLKQQSNRSSESIISGVQRSMRIVHSREMEKLETHLPFLASVGSISPYVGLFGTVWGIMAALQALGNVQQATVSMVAPGISEALIATAMGLFAAIPAVLAYNRYSSTVNRIEQQYETFQDELTTILHREATGAR